MNKDELITAIAEHSNLTKVDSERALNSLLKTIETTLTLPRNLSQMNKAELITAIAEHSKLTKADSERALNSLLKIIENTLKAGDSIVLVGFGSFEVKDRAARTGRNPQNGQEISIPAAKVPSFKPGKALKEAVNGS